MSLGTVRLLHIPVVHARTSPLKIFSRYNLDDFRDAHPEPSEDEAGIRPKNADAENPLRIQGQILGLGVKT